MGYMVGKSTTNLYYSCYSSIYCRSYSYLFGNYSEYLLSCLVPNGLSCPNVSVGHPDGRYGFPPKVRSVSRNEISSRSNESRRTFGHDRPFDMRQWTHLLKELALHNTRNLAENPTFFLRGTSCFLRVTSCNKKSLSRRNTKTEHEETRRKYC